MKKIIRIVITFALVAILESFMSLNGFCIEKNTKTQIEGKYEQIKGGEKNEDVQDEIYWDSLEMLAICVEAEAGNQDLYGKRLVVDVILNRVDSDRFPNDIVSVITEKYHFSTYWDGYMEKVTCPSEETYEAVRMELEHRTNDKILFFTAGDYNPYCTPAFKYKDHYFGY